MEVNGKIDEHLRSWRLWSARMSTAVHPACFAQIMSSKLSPTNHTCRENENGRAEIVLSLLRREAARAKRTGSPG